MKATKWITLAAVAQLALLVYMAVSRERILQFAPTVRLRTVPQDPDDPMRGSFSRLSYEFSSARAEHLRDGPATWVKSADSGYSYSRPSHRDDVVYALFKTDENGDFVFDALSDRRPASGQFLRGRVESIYSGMVNVRYGIEAYFTDKQRAEALDRDRAGAKRGVPLCVEIALADDGTAVLKRVEWEPLGITLTPVRPPPAAARAPDERGAPPPRPSVTSLVVEIKNHSNRPIGIIARPLGRSFRLVSADEQNGGGVHYAWTNEQVLLPSPKPEELRMLAPNEVYKETLNLTDPYWAVRPTSANMGKPSEMVTLDKVLDWSAAFRVVYDPALGKEPFSGRENIRPQKLLSARWRPSAGVD